MNLSKFISNKNILSGVVGINYDELLVAKLCVKCNTFKIFFLIILNVYLFGERTTNNGDYKKQINKCFPLI